MLNLDNKVSLQQNAQVNTKFTAGAAAAKADSLANLGKINTAGSVVSASSIFGNTETDPAGKAAAAKGDIASEQPAASTQTNE